MMQWSLSLVLIMHMGWLVTTAWAYNPQPAEGDFLLPMPGGRHMVFRPVALGAGGGPGALRQFQMGQPAGGVKEPLTQVEIGGAFQAEGQQDWLYYLGKYEVTEAQYAAIMAPEMQPSSPRDYPIRDISWFAAQDFVNRYNLWLLREARAALPQYGAARGYVRLPTEIEWEFAARGGAAASAPQFASTHPYPPDAVSKHEWFAGPASSHGKVKRVGLLQPNPLALHDMLGNVSEMTTSLYQLGYTRGRVGGFVARGGNYLTAVEHIRASLRTEQPFYTRAFTAQHSPTLGLRLALSALVLPPGPRHAPPLVGVGIPSPPAATFSTLRLLGLTLAFGLLLLVVYTSRRRRQAQQDKAASGRIAPEISHPGNADSPQQAAGNRPSEMPLKTRSNSLRMAFVLIPAGEFLMGSTDRDQEGGWPVHRVRISQPFYLGKYEVTQWQWQTVMGSNPSHFKGNPDLPVESISWEDAQAFIAKLNAREPGERYRLPTEAEWEYAARAGSTTAYSFGDHPVQLEQYAWYDKNAGGKTHPVGTRQPNTWGVHDMHGNVWEWVQDRYGPYSSAAVTEPVGPATWLGIFSFAPPIASAAVTEPAGPATGLIRVYRGGSWFNATRQCRAAFRMATFPINRYRYIGLRLVREVR